jgi:hypothetical protein
MDSITNALTTIKNNNPQAFTDPRTFKSMMNDLLKNDSEYRAIIRWLDISLTELDAYELLKRDYENNEAFMFHNLVESLIKVEGAPESVARDVIGYWAVLAGFKDIPISTVSAVSSASAIPQMKTDIPMFRYIGCFEHPKNIYIDISVGETFTIGRFDVSIDAKRSNFEFDKKTKAVSRKHASVKRNAEGYGIEDLYSKAGTFFDGEKLPPGKIYKLEHGTNISFGHLGADYIWEEQH